LSLRILEDRRKFEFHMLEPGERAQLIDLLRETLRTRGDVLAATVYGGFVKNQLFRDIDIAVFTGYTVPYARVEEYEDELSESLSRLVGIPVDVRVVDYAPPQFRVRALGGVVLIERVPALAARLRFKSQQEIEDIKAKIHRAVRA